MAGFSRMQGSRTPERRGSLPDVPGMASTSVHTRPVAAFPGGLHVRDLEASPAEPGSPEELAAAVQLMEERLQETELAMQSAVHQKHRELEAEKARYHQELAVTRSQLEMQHQIAAKDAQLARLQHQLEGPSTAGGRGSHLSASARALEAEAATLGEEAVQEAEAALELTVAAQRLENGPQKRIQLKEAKLSQVWAQEKHVFYK
jgi:hypothetical protein